MDELLPGVFHWTAFHEGIREDVHSHYFEPAAALIDPMLPAEGLDWFEGRERPQRILLTNRHHYRHSDRFREAFGCPVLCVEQGLHEFAGTGREVAGFSFGDEVAPGIVAREVGAICPDDSALHVVDSGVLAFADGLIRHDSGELAFVRDEFFDDPEGDQRGLRESFRRLLELDFDNLLFAHGPPLVGGGKRALREFAG